MSKPVTALQIEAYKTNITAHTGTSSQEERENLDRKYIDFKRGKKLSEYTILFYKLNALPALVIFNNITLDNT